MGETDGFRKQLDDLRANGEKQGLLNAVQICHAYASELLDEGLISEAGAASNLAYRIRCAVVND